VNRPPIGKPTATFNVGTEDLTYYILKDADYFQGFSDPNGDSLQAINIKTTHAAITSANGVWNLTPDKNYNGTIELTYDVIDNKGGSIPAKMSFVINPVNDAPIGKAVGFAAGNEDTNYILTASGLQDGFSDADYDTLSVTNLTATNGKITANADGTWLLTPNTNFNGTVQLNYTVSDNKGGSTNAVINFVLNPVDDAPIGSVFVSGETQQGKILAASNTLSDADGIGVISYQWLSNGSVINGANQTTYTLATSDVGKAISVKASYVDLQGTAESVSSSSTALALISAPTNYPPTGNVKITGNAIVSGTLSIENTLADGNGVGSFMYQWLRNNDAITNATKSTYTLTPEDAGDEITVVVGYIDGLGKQEGLASDAISISIPNHQPTGSLVIKGSPTVGNTLTLINTIQDADGLGEFSYSWETEDIVLTLSFDSETLKIDSDAFGKEIWATVSYIDGAGNYEEIKSEPTLAVTVAKISSVSSAGNDLLTGTTKADKLLGLAGDDTLIGGLGKDTLTGGSGIDIFKYTSVKDSGITATIRDTITDFKHSENDKIDLSALDANEKSAGDQTFAFIGNAAFSKTDATGQLRFDVKTGVLYASTDKDTTAEFSIKLNGVTSLVADDFVL
jgi:Ca2+-binding RTX toxin-like protein